MTLTCDMTKTCREPVGWVDHKGWLYCDSHGHRISWSRQARTLSDSELDTLRSGGTIWWDRERNHK